MAFTFVKKVAKGTLKTVANVPAWFGFDYLKDNTKAMVKMIRPIYRLKTDNINKMSFQEAVERYQLTDSDLRERMNNLQIQSVVFGTLAVLCFIYGFYLLFGLHILAAILAWGVTTYLLVKVVICRFWIFQIEQKKLGCSIQEWLSKNKTKG